ncbi:glycosyltransferase [Pseudoxanthomonas gei]|uniref:Glycosyltransferase n=1 Tax=Pseudoxanthomonas gei TaxID=1383030 RepID=A0ABX0ACV5_9GAMM|nr:glycosyltransferase family 4 protein [Pseudoxanthomonas gei]NDK38718.1 glycosyltransferase [Pseudoxanthomonas gei]
MTFRVLALPRYEQLGASSRLRTLQYLPALRAAGIDLEVHSLLDDRYVSGLYNGGISKPLVLKAYGSRVKDLLYSRRYDVVWTEKELLPWVPSSFELALLPAATRLLVDYDDAVFHRYDEHRSSLVRGILGHKVDAIMRRADLVTVGNSYLGARARSAGARAIEWLPTVVDLGRYPEPRVRPPREQLVVGWIGSPSTASYLGLLTPALAGLAARHPVRCVAIGARPDQVLGTPFEAIPWSEESEVQLLSDLDIGVMPLPDAPWERGKCGYKLIQYMACGLPVVASPVGVNSEMVVPGVNGYLASNTAEWANSIELLLEDPIMRQRMGHAGRDKVEQSYSLQVQAPRLAQMLQNLGRRAAQA